MSEKLDIFQIASKFEPKIRDALIKSFTFLQKQFTLDTIEEVIEKEGLIGAFRLIEELKVDPAISSEIIPELEKAINESGRQFIGFIPKKATTSIPYVFSLINPLSIAAFQSYEMRLIFSIGQHTKEAIRAAVRDGIMTGRNPRATARIFRDTIGLTPRQERAVRNYRKYLETLDLKSLQRTLRDHRFDRTIERAIRDNQFLSPQQVDKMVTRYRERFIKYRSETIARTESLRAVTMGQHEGMIQAIEIGAIEDEDLRKFWVFTKDERTRAAHRQIPGMNPEGVKLQENFQTPLGPLRYPRDPNGTGSNVINCRCRVVYKIID